MDEVINYKKIKNIGSMNAANAILNGNFVDTTGWSALKGTLSASNNTLSILANGSVAYARAQQLTSSKPPSGHKVYVRARVSVDGDADNIGLILRDGAIGTVLAEVYKLSPEQNTWYTVSAVVTLETLADNLFYIIQQWYADAATASGRTVQATGAMLLDLTEIYGSGNEPNADQMENELAYFNGFFDGTVNITTAKSIQHRLKNAETEVVALDQSVTDFIGLFTLSNNLMPKYREITDTYGYVGRWWDKLIDVTTYKATNNQGASIFFKVSGTASIDITFSEITAAAVTPQFAYSIDGGAFTRQIITNPTIALPDTSEHFIWIMIDGMGENDPISGGKWLGSVGVVFQGVNTGAGTVTGVLPSNRTIVFFGDSITEGINVLGVGADSTVNSAHKAYPFVCCDQLSAIPYYVGYGGTSVLGDASFHKCIDAINYYYNGVPTETIYPDLIVMNHGHNDYGLIELGTYTAQDFITAYGAALDRMAIKFPGVPIISVVPFAYRLRDEIAAVVATRKNCYLVDTQGLVYTKSDTSHPDEAGQIVCGNFVADEILSIMGKQFFM